MADELAPQPPPAPQPQKRRHRSGSAAHKPRRTKRGWGKPLAFGVFALIVTVGPLAFGAVDTAVQIAVTVLLGIGLMAYPPRMIPLPTWVWRVLLGLMLTLILKEVAPAWCFGKTSWRTSLTQSYGLALPWSHHPELGRAVDGWIAAIIAITWFAWVRTLAIEREDRERLAWTMLFAAAIVTLVSFATQGTDAAMIYGLRPTAGWRGFGPFPNRNHTACFLAIGLVVGSGVLVHAASKRQFGLLSAGCVAAAVALLGLLRTQSRGGLVALAIGALIYLILIVAKQRSGKALAIGAAVIVLVGTIALVAGTKTLGRFGGANVSGDVSVSTRIDVWQNAIAMWRDAPLLGHGLGAFQSIFPMYQQLDVTEAIVKHPESSWLQALTELGLIPVSLFVVVLGAFLVPHVRFTFSRRTSFYVRAAALAGVAVLMVHSIFDVPAHRWGTIGLAIAALALACPATGETIASRRAAILPLGVAAFWALPLWLDGPTWSTFQLDRLLVRDQTGHVMLSEIDQSLRHFPLNATLHLAAGERLLAARAMPPSRWQNEFRIAARLMPGSSEICMTIARLCRPVEPLIALHYWQMAVERAGQRRVDTFHLALRETQGIRDALATWEGYVTAQPDLALVFSEKVPSEQGRDYFALWWRDRGSTNAEIPDAEAETFLRLAAQWGTPEQLQQWMATHDAHRLREYRQWAALLHHWGRDNEAWTLLHGQISEPTFPSFMPKAPRDQLEFRWVHSPGDIVNARNYAQLLQASDDVAGMENVILAVADTADAPKWFLEKAAHILARKHEYARAVELVLRAPHGAAG